jgi:hypothetical protein
MRMNFWLLVLGLLSTVSVSAQVKLPTIIPPSPEVAQLGKVGSMSTGLHTGSANVTIPLYNFAINAASVNLMLSYNSNGIKVDEIPGRVGTGWNLVAGGMVNRVIHDEPDGEATFVTPPANLNNKNQTLLDYLNYVTSGTFDTEWDEYSYSFNGMSGKFYLDSTGKGYCIPHSNMKVQVSGYNSASKSIQITTADGVLFKFGISTKEKTKSISIGGGPTGTVTKTAAYETAWFLDQVVTQEGRLIDFNYSAILIRTRQGSYQTMIKPMIMETVCGEYVSPPSPQTGINAIEYDSYYLTGINADNTIFVNFTYENRPDSSGDKRLTQIDVNSDGLLKRYAFQYLTPSTNNNTYNKRFFLEKIRTLEKLAVESNPEKWLDHDFSYIDINGMAPRMSYSQDWFGYYNGVSNSYFAPYVPAIAASVQGGNVGADRNPGTLEHMQKGMLETVTYPTGGTETFIYEPHTLLKYGSSTTFQNYSTNGGGSGTSSPVTHTSSTFTANSNQTADISLSSYKSPAFPNDPDPFFPEKIFELKVVKTTTGEVIFFRRFFYYTAESATVPLLNGATYRLELTIWGQLNAGTATINLNYSTSGTYENKIVGGVRVKKIYSYDPVSKKTNKKFYRYAALSDTSKSSGVGPYATINYVEYVLAQLCVDSILPYTDPYNNYMVSANSITPYYTFGGSNVAYATVIESDDSLWTNGFTEHWFHTLYPGSSSFYIYLGNNLLGTPSDINVDNNGAEYRTRVYKRSSSTNILLQETNQYYSINEALNYICSSHIVQKRYSDNQHYTPPESAEFGGFDLVQYNHSSGWIKLDSTYVTQYDQSGANPLSTITRYTYDSISHMQATRVEVTASDNIPLITINKYPTDFAVASPVNVYQKMRNTHRIQDVVEVKTYKGATELNTVKNEFDDWFGDSKVIKPQIIKTKKTSSGTLENRMRYHKYDAKSNPLLVSMENDVLLAYIWDYGNYFPTAEVKLIGAIDDTVIAYTSFETSGKGNWNFTTNSTSDVSAPTGDYCYSLTNGDITRSVNSAKTYTVSYWLKSSSGAVSVNGTSATLFTTKNGWSCYRHSVSAASTVTVSGTGRIDELRLYPAGSQMTTLAYRPFVGAVAICSSNDELALYEYDDANRLKVIRDGDRKIIKQFRYEYAETAPDCGSTTPNWVATGLVRCFQTGPNNNYNGQKEQQERDLNVCSPTYLQYRYTNIGGSYEECPGLVCTGADKRVVNGVCETGQIIILTSFFNGTQWECTYRYQWSDGFLSPIYNGTGLICLNES